MPTLLEQRDTAAAEARAIAEGAKAAGRDNLTAEEMAAVNEKLDAIKSLDEKIANAKKSEDIMSRIEGLGGTTKGAGNGGETGDEQPAKSLGEHFVKSIGEAGLGQLKTGSNVTVAASEFTGAKAASDAHVVGSVFTPYNTDFDRTVINTYRRPVVSDVLGTGTISGTQVTYLVEGAVEGGFATVAEGGKKPQFHIGDPTTRTDGLKKIAGILKFTDEMVEDVPWWVSEINNRGLYLLQLAEENQLLNGTGTGNNVLGLLNRSGIQTETAAAVADNADALFRASTKVQTATGLSADALLINPIDYQALRLSKDANGQYFGGGFFAGQYGNGGIVSQPPVWGLNTVVTAAVAAGTAVVGALKVATTVYRKGGVRVESTNSNVDDFENNLITTRIEERAALAVRVPAAVVKVTLSTGA